MSFKLDFSGYEAMLPFIEDAKTSRVSSKDVIESIKKNHAMSGVFKFTKKDYGVTADVLLNVIYNAFSRAGEDKATGSRSLSHLKQTYDWCRRNWDLVMASVDFLRSTDLEVVVKERAAEYLPSDVVFPDLTVYFVFDGCDGRGFKSQVYMDVTLCAILGREKSIGLLAHEYHHSCRADFALQCSSPKWKNVLETLFYLESEGVADKIYNLGGVLPDNSFPPLRQLIRQRTKFYRHAHIHLAEVEKGILTDANPRKIFSKGLNHPLGNYMADLIERRLGKVALVDCVGDPLKFLETYNEAAELEKEEKGNTFVFSEAVMSKLERVRKDL